MTHEQIEALCDLLFSLSYETAYEASVRTYKLPIIRSEHRNTVKQAVTSFVKENIQSVKGELEAKVYAYEQIIAKSNFAPLIERKKDEA